MNYDDIFKTYYSLYRNDPAVPVEGQDEYEVGKQLANTAIRRWANYDDVYWKELFVSTRNAADGELIVTGAIEYACPSDMREAGGWIKLYDPISNARVATVKVIEPEQGQFYNDFSMYCYFTGNANTGFVLHLNLGTNTQYIGCVIQYIYYKKPTLITDAASTPDMADPMYIVHSMLANAYRSSRNPFYTSAGDEAEDALKAMQASNNSGTWTDPWQLIDTSGTGWGR